MTTENEFTCKQVLFADILGFSKLTNEQKEKAESKLKKFRDICNELIAGIEKEKRYYHPFSDSIVVGFKEIKDAISFSKKLFCKTFEEKIHLRGTIGIGEFTYKKGQPEFGTSLVRATIAEKYELKGHTLLLVCETNQFHDFRGFGGLSPFLIPKLPKELKAFIICWWEKSEKLKNDIKERINELTVDDLIYLEATKENIDKKYSNEKGDIDDW